MRNTEIGAASANATTSLGPHSRFHATALLACVCALPPLVSAVHSHAFEKLHLLALSLLISFAGAFAGTDWLVQPVCARALKRGLYGADLNKPRVQSKGHQHTNPSPRVPEATGLAAGTAFLLCAAATVLGHGPAERLAEFHAGLLSAAVMLLAGFADDVFDLPWRVKLVLPVAAATPLLASYDGPTTVVIPKLLRPLLAHFATASSETSAQGAYIELGVVYKVYMLLVAVFCSNAINIHAGINGLEVGQTAILASGVLALNFQSLASSPSHAYSARLMAPLLGACLGMFRHNAYPSAVFPGDTFTFFAGMSLAVAAILGHLTEALLVLMSPQLINFVISLPQLLGVVHCPRHRLPKLHPETGKLHSSGNLTLLNVILYLAGPRHERTLCIIALLLQAGAIGMLFLLRYLLLAAGMYK